MLKRLRACTLHAVMVNQLPEELLICCFRSSLGKCKANLLICLAVNLQPSQHTMTSGQASAVTAVQSVLLCKANFLEALICSLLNEGA